jgi:hypothetical protein
MLKPLLPQMRAKQSIFNQTGLTVFLFCSRQFDLPYLVEQWDDTDSHVEELIASTGDYRVARAAYVEAVKRRPGRIVTLRQKSSSALRRQRAGEPPTQFKRFASIVVPHRVAHSPLSSPTERS